MTRPTRPTPAATPRRAAASRRRGDDLARQVYLTGGVLCLFVAAMLLAGWRPW